jgi:hypothetical protein
VTIWAVIAALIDQPATRRENTIQHGGHAEPAPRGPEICESSIQRRYQRLCR